MFSSTPKGKASKRGNEMAIAATVLGAAERKAAEATASGSSPENAMVNGVLAAKLREKVEKAKLDLGVTRKRHEQAAAVLKEELGSYVRTTLDCFEHVRIASLCCGCSTGRAVSSSDVPYL